jgi:signal transduction histidine kinase
LRRDVSLKFPNYNPSKRGEEVLKSAYDELKTMVNERTLELINKNALLESEIKERKQIQELLDERLRFETILSDLSAEIVSVSAAMLERKIDAALRVLVEYLEVDWGTLILFEDNRKKEGITHSYAIRGNPLTLDILNEKYLWFWRKLQHGETIVLGKIPDGLPSESNEERKYCLEEGHKAILVIPLKVGNGSWGAIAFGSVQSERNWSIEIIRRLKLAGEILANAIVRKRAEEILRSSESEKKAILDASVDRIRYVDKNMRIIWANKASGLRAGIPAEELIGRRCYEVNHGTDSPCEGCPTVRSMATGQVERKVMHYPQVLIEEGGEYGDNYCVPLRNGKGEADRFVQVYRDITVQKHAEEKIYTLSQELIRAQERERQMISRELHDTVAQDLCSLKVACETLFDNHSLVSPKLKERIAEIANNLQRTIIAVRDLSYDLRPSGLDELGLVEVLSHYCEGFGEKTKVKVNFHSVGVGSAKFDFDTEINLYRIVQEGLNNILKHAQATEAKVSFIGAFPHIILRIEDNGKGFDLKERLAAINNEKRMGLQSMKERVNLLKGEVNIQTRPMRGTKISVKIPYPEKADG